MSRFSLPCAAAFCVVLLASGCAHNETRPAQQAATPVAGGAARSPGLPTPDPALRKLDRLVGTWSMKGHLAGSDKQDIIGQATFHWLDGGFFLQQDLDTDFGGTARIRNLELIGFDAESKTLTSSVYSNVSPVPVPYRWDVQGNTLTISVSHGQLNATFTATFSDDGTSFTGGWRPNPGADEKINASYDVVATRAG